MNSPTENVHYIVDTHYVMSLWLRQSPNGKIIGLCLQTDERRLHVLLIAFVALVVHSGVKCYICRLKCASVDLLSWSIAATAVGLVPRTLQSIVSVYNGAKRAVAGSKARSLVQLMCLTTAELYTRLISNAIHLVSSLLYDLRAQLYRPIEHRLCSVSIHILVLQRIVFSSTSKQE